ncbi:MAG: hypothetical protein M3Q48_11515 [Actinomycetota bacterium]|nr:hypothetical protein [Actinomycetota bacterium]
MPAAPPTVPRPGFEQVVLATGHMTDRPHRSAPRFPASDEEAVTEAIEHTLRRWGVGEGALVISGGARGADILVAEQAMARGAEVWLLVALPDDEFLAASVDAPGGDWAARYRDLRRRCPTWFQTEELGPARDDEDVFERNNNWCLEAARAQAPPGGLRVVAVWDGRPGDGRGGTSHLVEQARRAGASVEVIHPPASLYP